MTTVLELVQEVADDLGYECPETLYGTEATSDETDRRLRRALTRTCRFLLSHYNWKDLESIIEPTFYGQSEISIPSDFDRFRKEGAWNVTNECDLEGPFRLDEFLRSKDVEKDCFGLFKESLWVYSSNSSSTFRIPYIQNTFVIPQTGNRCPKITRDNDRVIWKDELMHLGIVWACLNRDGDATGDDYDSFVNEVENQLAFESTGTTLNMGGGTAEADRFPETGWGADAT